MLAVVLSLLFCPAAWAGQGILEDGAGLLSAQEQRELEEEAKGLAGWTGYDLMLITTEDSGGKSAMEYAEDFYMDHYTTLDGAACLIDMDNREIYVATSGEARFLLDDDRIETILDHAYDSVSEARYGEAFQGMLEDIGIFAQEGILQGAYIRDIDTGEIVRYEEPKQLTALEALVSLAGGIIVFGLFFGITVGRYRMKLGKYRYSYRDNSEVRLDEREDFLVNRIVTHRRIPKNPPSSGGGGGHGGHHSSGSSVHRGSHGNSFGGGGRKF